MSTNPDYYPTPSSVIDTMVAPYREKIPLLQILEPSAGGGAILDYLTDTLYRKAPKKNVFAIERDPELAFTLQGKGYKLIENDFLDYNGDYAFDLILMNPPFSTGADHLLKAWDVLKSGSIACLLNQQTIDNIFSKKRELLATIINDHGTTESLGPVFRNSSRPTNVNVVLVRLTKKEADPRFAMNFDFVPESEYDFGPEIAGNALAINDVTGALLRSYEMTRHAYANYIRAKDALHFYGKDFIQRTKAGVTILETADSCYKEPTPAAAYNQFVNLLNAGAWRGILSKMQIEKVFTNGVYKNLEKFRESQGSMELTRENVFSLIEMLVLNRESIMDDAIVDVFDKFTQFHKENRCHVEGWVTNSSWKVNKKVILPWYLDNDHRWISSNSTYSVRHEKQREFDDIDKVMCWLSGQNYDEMNAPIEDYPYSTPEWKKEYKRNSLNRAIHRIVVGDAGLHESEFFNFRCYKKGTLHITFKSEHLWAIFNQRACKGKNWLPK